MQVWQYRRKLIVTIRIRLYTGHLNDLPVDAVELLYRLLYQTYDFGKLTEHRFHAERMRSRFQIKHIRIAVFICKHILTPALSVGKCIVRHFFKRHLPIYGNTP